MRTQPEGHFPDSLAHARFLVRRLRRRLPAAAIIVGLWTFPPSDASRRDRFEATRADHVVTSLSEAMEVIAGSVALVSQDAEAPELERDMPEPRPLKVS